MSFNIQHLSSNDFRINNYYIYKDGNGKWISNPPVDSSDTNLQQAITETINSLEHV